MAVVDKEKVFDGEQIRDTNLHTSPEAAQGEFICLSVLVINGLDKDVDMQLQGAVGSDWFDVGPEFTVSAGVNSYETTTDYFEKYRITAKSPLVAPTSGGLTVIFLKYR